MSFEKQLERLVNAINRKKGAALSREVVVGTQDLRELIFQFNRVDKELREHKQNFKQKEFEYRTEYQNIISKARVEADNMPDRLAELEKVMLEHYIAKGYQVGVGNWCFRVDIASHYRDKGIFTYFYDNDDKELVNRFLGDTTKEIWDKAIKHFSPGTNLSRDDEYAKGGAVDLSNFAEDILQITKKLENQNTFYKLLGYESDGTE